MFNESAFIAAGGHCLMNSYGGPNNTVHNVPGIPAYMPQPFPKNNPARYPPAYNVAAQRALLHRLGRAHSHEGVTSSINLQITPAAYYQPNIIVSGSVLSSDNDTDDNGI